MTDRLGKAPLAKTLPVRLGRAGSGLTSGVRQILSGGPNEDCDCADRICQGEARKTAFLSKKLCFLRIFCLLCEPVSMYCC